MTNETRERLEYLRAELRAERISWGELAELQSLADQIDHGDVELLEAAGVPEHGNERADLACEVGAKNGADMLQRATDLYGDETEADITDAATDLLHLAAREGLDVGAIHARIWRHYMAEQHEAADA